VLDLFDAAGRRHAWAPLDALKMIAREGCGVLVLLNCGETPQQLQQRIGTWSAPEAASAPPRTAAADLRTYGIGAQILRDVGVGRMRLMAKPRKMPSMAGFGLTAVGYLENG
jgi:3,4-dihydroxy 2-butanone 4-phosphate synthase/GTP cyclohydrolase II